MNKHLETLIFKNIIWNHKQQNNCIQWVSAFVMLVFTDTDRKNFLVFMEIFSFWTDSGNLCLHSTQICQVHTNKCASLFYFIESCFFKCNNTLLLGTEKHIYLFAAMTSGLQPSFLPERCNVKTCFLGLTFQIKKEKHYRFIAINGRGKISSFLHL